MLHRQYGSLRGRLMTAKPARTSAIEAAVTPVEDVTYYRYVPHSRRASYEAIGWLSTAVLEGHHGYWSVLMIWAGDGEPQEPMK
jgi:hypothetical protein